MNNFGELLLAALQLGPFLRREHPRVTKAIHAQAVRLPKLIREQIREFINGDPPEKLPKLPTFDYLKMLEKVSRPIEPHDLENMVDAHQAPQDAMDFYMAASRAIAYLSGVAVRRSKQTLTGATPLIPSDMEVERFRRAYTVVEDPVWPLRKMRNLMLLPDEVAALVSVYPGIYQMVGQIVQDELAAAKTRKGQKWDLPADKEKQLMQLLQMAPADASLVKDMQASYGDQPTDQEQAAPQGKSKVDLKSESLQTVGQKAEAGGR